MFPDLDIAKLKLHAYMIMVVFFGRRGMTLLGMVQLKRQASYSVKFMSLPSLDHQSVQAVSAIRFCNSYSNMQIQVPGPDSDLPNSVPLPLDSWDAEASQCQKCV